MTATLTHPTTLDAYRVNLRALVHRDGTYLLIKPQDTQPDPRWTLPGLWLTAGTGPGFAEQQLRRRLLSQLGVIVGDLTLSGSDVTLPPAPRPDQRERRLTPELQLLLSSEYVSGLLTPYPEDLHRAEWFSARDLHDHPIHPWALDAVHTHLARHAPASRRAASGPLSFVTGRRR